MPFTDISELESTTPISKPLYLFPDVTGNHIGLLQLGSELQKANNNKSKIYAWDDTVASALGNNLDGYSAEIASQIVKIQPEGPLFLAGYSWGSILASLVSQKLQAAGRLVAFYGIDSPSIVGSQIHLQAFNLAATNDLISIYRYVVELAGRDHSHSNPALLLPDLKAQEVQYLTRLPFGTQITHLREQFSAAIQDQNTKITFDNYSAVVAHNLSGILLYQNHFNCAPLPTIGLFFSGESRKKYHFDVEKSWTNIGSQRSVYFLDNTDHLSLIRNKQICRIIANHMTIFFENYFSPTESLRSLDGGFHAELNHLFDSQKTIKDEEMKISLDSDPNERTPPCTPQVSPKKEKGFSFFGASFLSSSTPPNSPRLSESGRSETSENFETLLPYQPSSRTASPYTPSISPPPYISAAPSISDCDLSEPSSMDSSETSASESSFRGYSRPRLILCSPRSQTPPLAHSAPSSFVFGSFPQPKLGHQQMTNKARRAKQYSPAPPVYSHSTSTSPTLFPTPPIRNTRRIEKQRNAALLGDTSPREVIPSFKMNSGGGEFGH